jgi:hypothetical protein
VWSKRSKLLVVILVALGFSQVPSASLAASTIQSSICGQFLGPTITAPPPGSQTNDASIIVQGAGEPSMAVTILRDGQATGVTLIAPDGSYALEVPLAVGVNSLVAHEADPCGTIKESAPLVVERLSPPEPPKEEPASVPSGALPIFPGVDQTNRPLERPITITPPTPGYQKPTVTYPGGPITTHSGKLWVRGKAQPGSTVIVYVNGISAARVIASENGDYSVLITLKEGDNSLQVKARLGDASAVSDSVAVIYVNQQLATLPSVEAIVAPQIILLGFAFVITLGVGWLFVFRVKAPK